MNSVHTLDVRAHIDSRPMSAYQWLLLALCFLIITTDGIDVAIMGFLAPAITTASAPPPSCPGTDGAPCWSPAASSRWPACPSTCG
jgi:hypothetical protein